MGITKLIRERASSKALERMRDLKRGQAEKRMQTQDAGGDNDSYARKGFKQRIGEGANSQARAGRKRMKPQDAAVQRKMRR